MTDRYTSSHVVAQACGMVSIQASCSVEEALVMLCDCAESTMKLADDVALDVVERRIRFAPPQRGAEPRRGPDRDYPHAARIGGSAEEGSRRQRRE
jgi:hypothetical protein